MHRELAHRIDAIVHCAALTDFAPPDLNSFTDVNVEGTRRILRASRVRAVPSRSVARQNAHSRVFGGRRKLTAEQLAAIDALGVDRA